MKLLMITYHFPPDGAVGALRPYHFARLLPQYGIEPWVLTIAREHIEQLDPTMEVTEIPPERVIRTEVLPSKRDRYLLLKRRLQEIRGKRSESEGLAPVGSEIGSAKPLWRRWIAAWLSFPDWHHGWYHPALAEARRLHKLHRFDAIFSTSPPRTPHLIARRLARELRIPWMMDMRDPWTVDWSGDAVILYPFSRWYESLLAGCMQEARWIVLNTEALRRYMVQNYPQFERKMYALPNGIDERTINHFEETGMLDVMLIGHFGTIYGKRDLTPFLCGLQRWLERHPEARTRVQVGLWGEIHNLEFPKAVDALHLQGVVQVRDRIPRHMVRGVIKQCYALLLIATEQPLQIPGKVYEYIAAGRRILALTEKDSATAELLNGHPHCLIVSNEEEVTQALETCWNDFVSERSAFVKHEGLILQFAYPTITRQLADLLGATS